MLEMWVPSLGWEDPLEEGMMTHSNISWTEEPGGLQSIGFQRVRQDWSDVAYMHAHSDKLVATPLSTFHFSKDVSSEIYHLAAVSLLSLCPWRLMPFYHCYFFVLFICFGGQHWVFIAVHRLSLVAASRGYSLFAVHGRLTAVASLVEHGL